MLDAYKSLWKELCSMQSQQWTEKSISQKEKVEKQEEIGRMPPPSSSPPSSHSPPVNLTQIIHTLCTTNVLNIIKTFVIFYFIFATKFIYFSNYRLLKKKHHFTYSFMLPLPQFVTDF